jgi:hypothetical protein
VDMEIVTTSGVSATEVPADVAADLAQAYERLAELPVNRAVAVDFSDAKAARLFVKQGKAWAATQGLTFARKGDIKGLPNRVTFRIYVPRNSDEVTENAATE